MTASEIYTRQGELRRAQRDLNDLDAEAPEYRDALARVGAIARDVAAIQDDFGGVVYRVASYKVDPLVKKLDALTKRAAKNDLGSFEYHVTDEVDEVAEYAPYCAPDNPFGNPVTVVKIHRFTYVVVRADRLKIAGWALLAKLQVEEAGVLVSKIPALARAWDLQREGATDVSLEALEASAKTYLDETNLVFFANPETASNCDHCGLARRRTATYVVEDLGTGERKQVGSNCLRDFLGVDPNQIAKYAEMLYDLDVALSDEDDEERGYGGSRRADFATKAYLTHVCTMIRLYGWAPRSGSDRPTANQAAQNLRAFASDERDKQGRKCYETPTVEDDERAEAAIAWATSYIAAKVADGAASDFDRNLYIAAANSTVSDRTEGVLAYLPIAHARYLEKEIEFSRQREEAAESVHVGTVGERLTLTLTVLSVFEHEGHYGTTFITQFADEAGNRFKWFGSYSLERGDTYTGKWTVKDHGEWKGTKETQITRPKLAEPTPTEDQTALEVTS